MNFPVKVANDKKREWKVIELVDEVMNLNTELHRLDPILERERCGELNDGIKKTEADIDEEVYKLYGLTTEEIKIVERP